MLDDDVARYEATLAEQVQSSRFLVIGGEPSGLAVTREISGNPKAEHVRAEENNAGGVNATSQTLGYGDGDSGHSPLTAGIIFDALMLGRGTIGVLNLSALKHVATKIRSP